MKFSLKSIDTSSNLKLVIDDCYEKNNNSTTDLLFVIEGTVRVNNDSLEKEFTQSDFLIINKFEDYCFEPLSESSTVFIFEISDTLLNQAIMIDGVSFKGNSHDSINESAHREVKKIVLKIFELLLLDEYRANFLIYGSVYELINTLVGHYSVQSQFSNQKDVKNREIIKYIYIHHASPLTLSEIAEYFYMDPSYFSKYFKKYFGVNFKDYLLNIRLSFAERDIILTDNSMVRIANDNGFSNISSFNKAFKTFHGISPTVFRKKNKKNIGQKEKSLADEPLDYRELSLRYEKSKHAALDADKNNVTTIDSSLAGVRLNPIWNSILNIGPASDLLSERVKSQICVLNTDVPFKYARIWSLFLEEQYVDWKYGKIINFEIYDEIFDSLLKQNVIPWIVINKYSPNTERMVNITLFSTEKWVSILKTFMIHVIDRYGLEKVKHWKFEIVIENLNDSDEIDKFNEIYTKTYDVIKWIDSSIAVGGAGFKGFVPLEKLKLLSTIEKFDFYSFMIYPYLRSVSKERRDAQRITNPNHVSDSLKSILETLDYLPKKTLYISEWNLTASNHNLINDTLYKGTYFLKNILDMIDKVEGVGYWCALDLNYLTPSDTGFLTGGSGLINKFGLKKPSFVALFYLAHLENKHIISIGSNYIICRDYREIHILLFNCIHPNQLYFMKKENEILPEDIDKFFDNESVKQIFHLHHLESGIYDIRTYTCDSKNGSIFDLWREFNFAKQLRSTDYTYLNQKNVPHMQLTSAMVEDNKLTINQLLESNTFCMINILKRQK